MLRAFTSFGIATLCLMLGMTLPAKAGDATADRSDVHAAHPLPAPQAMYKIVAGLDGEIYPMFANYASLQPQGQRSFGVLSLTVSNPADAALRERVAVKIVGWSDEEIQITEIPASGQKTLIFAPSFLPRFYSNHELVAATAQLTVSDLAGNTLYETTIPVRLRSVEDMYWGRNFQFAQFIASWVTPHDSRIESVLVSAKKYTSDNRLPGYEDWKNPKEQEQETYQEARAIFLALQRMGMSYMKSSVTLGGHTSVSERVRMPRVSLDQNSANCIDAAVMYASLFENLGMDSQITVVPGHAYVGVRVAPGSPDFLFIDAALTGRTTFEGAVTSARVGLSERPASSITRVIVQDARSAGIYPMP